MRLLYYYFMFYDNDFVERKLLSGSFFQVVAVVSAGGIFDKGCLARINPQHCTIYLKFKVQSSKFKVESSKLKVESDDAVVHSNKYEVVRPNKSV